MINQNVIAPIEDEQTREEKETHLALAQSFVARVNENLNDIKHSFFKIAFNLNEANRNEYHKGLGYATLSDLAEDVWGFKKSTTYNLLEIYKLAHDPFQPMQIAQKYEKFSQSHLVAITRLKFRGADIISVIQNSECSVRELEKFVSLWNKKYAKGCGYRPECKTVAEYLKKYEEEDSKKEKNYSGQLPGQQALETEFFQTFGKIDKEVREIASKAIDTTNLDEPTEDVIECELIKAKEESTADFVDGEDYSQYEEDEFVYMSDDELAKYCFKEGRHVNKFEIYDTVLNYEGTTDAFIKYIKNEYGNGGWGGGDKHYSEVNTSSKGFEIVRKTGGKLILSWNIVAGRIKRLIESGEYLTAAEQKQYLKWKAEQDGLVVNVEDGQAAAESEQSADVLPVSDKEYDNLIKDLDELIEPKNKAKAKLLHLKNDKARKAWLDDFRSWGVWLEVKEVSKTFYRYNFANGCAVVVEVGIEYGDGYSIKKGEREILKYSILNTEHPKYDTHGISYTTVIQWLSLHGKEV